MGEHAYFSPSASSRWIPCPVSLYLSESKGDSGTSKFAHEGTVCHEIAATCLTKQGNPSDFQGKIVQKVTITPELVAGMQLYVDEIRGLAKEYNATGGKIEHKVTLTDDCWGTVDALLWNKNTILVGDLKMGKGIVVDVEDNSQLKLYSIGALQWLQEEHKIRPIEVINIIIQPRTPNPIRVTKIPYEELLDWYESTVIGILKTCGRGKQSLEPCNPGVTQCRWCPINATCAAQANKIINDAQKAFQPFTKIHAPKVTKIDGELSITELTEYKKAFTHIQQWMKEINSYIFEQALAGEDTPGFKLVEGRSNRIWKVEEKSVEVFLRNLNVEPYVKKLVSPPQAEKILGKKRAKEYNLAKFITKPQGEPTLASESDKRPVFRRITDKQAEDKFSELVPAPTSLADEKETILISEDEGENDNTQMSTLKRMQMAAFENEDENENEDELIIPEHIEIATGGNSKCTVDVRSLKTGVPPAQKTQRYHVLQFGLRKGGTTIHEAANALGCKDNMIKMHLRYLNERDGYSYKLFDDDTFTVS